MGNAFQPAHLLLLLLIILVLFGAAKLPALAKSLGQSARAFKGEMKAMKEDDLADAAAKNVAADASVAAEPLAVQPPAPQAQNPDAPRL